MNSKVPAPKINNDVDHVKSDLFRHFNYTLGAFGTKSLSKDMMKALSITVRDRIMACWKQTKDDRLESKEKRVYYLSLEFLLGRSLSNALLNVDMEESIKSALLDLGCSLEDLEAEEKDAGLGNGGLGRLAACFMDSCASLDLSVTGYGIRYEYGMFHQSMCEGHQVEQPDHWLMSGNPWEVERQDRTRRIKFYGYTDFYHNDAGEECARWVCTQDVLAVPYDMPIPGYRNGVVNTLRLWKAEATDEFDLQDFNAGDYAEAVAEKNLAEQITMVLYPNDSSENGKELRLRQQYFLASASLQDVLADWVCNHGENFETFSAKNCFQLNDTHPTLAIAELMRLMLDEHHLNWDQAWEITRNSMAYTNHTLLPEALEKWPVRLMKELLPRLLDIIYEINARFLAEVAHHWPAQTELQQRMSIIEEGPEQFVRMAHLGIVGSFSVNGVAALHSQLLTVGLFKDFYGIWPEKFNNKTNGVTPRRWLAHCNREQSALMTSVIGDSWITDLSRIDKLAPYAEDASFRKKWAEVKRNNKVNLADLVKKETGVEFNVDSIFDVQVKRIHEYKRQLLNVLHVIHLYDRIIRGDIEGIEPRSILIGGKAAPGYFLAKRLIKLINNVAQVINSDENVSKYIKLVFFPNYRVSSMEVICPATDISEQISTAGKEASGTGNMKFMMNGAITVGTYDGANIEIMEAVGEENFFLFGLRVEDIPAYRERYTPNDIIAADDDLTRVMNLLECGHFSMFEPGIFQPIIDAIRSPSDPWMVAADFRDYINVQREADKAYKDKEGWIKKSILNAASSGRFSSDRTIAEYASDIWGLEDH